MEESMRKRLEITQARLTQIEKELVVQKIEDWCIKNYNMSAKELVDKTRNENI